MVEAAAALGIDPRSAVVVEEDYGLVVRPTRAQGTVEVAYLVDDGSGWELYPAWVGGDPGVAFSSTLSAGGGPRGEGVLSVFAGNVPTGVERVELRDREALGGTVYDGVFALAVPGVEMTPDELHWTMLGAGGSHILDGDGLYGCPVCAPDRLNP